MHAYALERITPLLSSFDSVRATDPTLKPAIDRTSLLLSSFDSVRAIDVALKPSIDLAHDHTGIALERTDPVLNFFIA